MKHDYRLSAARRPAQHSDVVIARAGFSHSSNNNIQRALFRQLNGPPKVPTHVPNPNHPFNSNPI